MERVITKCWWFPSSSAPNDSKRDYETLQYSDGTTSCKCKGWILGGKRLDANGNRSCKHTRFIDAGMADQEARRHLDYGQTAQTVSHPAAQKSPKKLTKIKLEATPARKIVW